MKGLEKSLAALPEVVHFETLSVGDIWGERFHTTPSHELIHVLQGRARIEYLRRSFSVGPGDTFVIPQGIAHRDIRAPGPAYRVFYLFFRWPEGAAVLRGMNPDALLRVPAGAQAHLHRLMKELEEEYLGETSAAIERMRVLLLEVLLALTRHAHRHRMERPIPEARRLVARDRRRKLVSEVSQFMQAHYAEHLGLEALAARWNVSPFNLSRCFSQETGQAIMDTLATLRVERAQELLLNEILSIKEVAAGVGYANGNYFAKVFRRTTGLSPSEYQIKFRRAKAGEKWAGSKMTQR